MADNKSPADLSQKQKEKTKIDVNGYTSENGFKLLDAFFEHVRFVSHHIDSYSYFIKKIIPETIVDAPPFIYDVDDYYFSFYFTNIYIHSPGVMEANGTISELWPNQCRLRSITYSSPVFVKAVKTFKVKATNQITSETETFLAGYLPIMVKGEGCRLENASQEQMIEAGECEYDQGGYFIIGGTERILMGMERMAHNQVYFFRDRFNSDKVWAEISSLEEKARKAPSNFFIDICFHPNLGKLFLQANFNGYFKKSFSLGILLIALGFDSKGMKYIILNQKLLRTVTGKQGRKLNEILDFLEESVDGWDRDRAYEYLASIGTTVASTEAKKQAYVQAVLEKEFLPHVGIDEESFPNKAWFVIYMIQGLLCRFIKDSSGEPLRTFDDHDHTKNKRIDSSGMLLGAIFKQSWNKVVKEISLIVRRKLKSGTDISRIILSQLLNNLSMTKDIVYCLASGNWSVIRNSKMKTGVSQVLNRFNYQAYLSHCRRVINPLPKDSTLHNPRKLHSSSWGFICIAETPEGRSVGLVKNKALTTMISIPYPDGNLCEMLVERGVKYRRSDLISDDVWTLNINGKIMYSDTNEPFTFIRGLKLDGLLPPHISVVCDDDHQEITTYTDGGRVCRPVLVIRDGKIALSKEHIEDLNKGKLKWPDLLRMGIIEMIDAYEQENYLIACFPDELKRGHPYTHLEINPVVILGVCANTVPYGNHNPSARMTYQTSMCKQALSVPMVNYQQRMDSSLHVLNYPQKSLCPTRVMTSMYSDQLPAGQQAIVFINTSGGWNQEDAIVLNKAAVERGLFHSTFYRVYKDNESKVVGSEEKFAIPVDEPGCDKLGPDGVIKIGAKVEEGDVLIGKVSNAVGVDGQRIKPRLVRVRNGENGVVDSVSITVSPDGSRLCKVKIRQHRVPQVGDKFAGQPSQKGLCSILLPQEDLPFTKDGMYPDMIINACSQPSRMTYGYVKEYRAGKAAALSGKEQDSTTFAEHDDNEIGKALISSGYSSLGYEICYDGRTGEAFKCRIYTGSCHYQRLKHMVTDKMHARGMKGPIVTLTKQPAEGRSREGGLKIGEMERDCLISLGASSTIQERLCNLSDKFKVIVCPKCGLLATGNQMKGLWFCRACKNKEVAQVEMPYITELLIQELYACNIAPRLLVNP